jgi:hypothetical protein
MTNFARSFEQVDAPIDFDYWDAEVGETIGVFDFVYLSPRMSLRLMR